MRNLAMVLALCISSPALAGSLQYRIVDPDRRPIPAKLTFLVEDGTKRADIEIESKSPGWAGRKGVAYTLPGDVPIPLPDGKYRVFASHGFEWTVVEALVEVKAGPPALFEATLERVVDTKGYLSADLHLHTLTFSGHGDVNLDERIITLAAEEVEWAVATDHNVLTDYKPLVERLGATRWMKTTVGNEVTTTLLGHFNAFPLDPSRPPVDWRVADPGELFRLIRAGGAAIIQVNHPRWTGAKGAYFRDVDLSPFTGDSTNPLFSRDFDSFEVLNGNDLSGWDFAPEFGTGALPALDHSVREDWYNLLNVGFSFTAVGNSDSHHADAVIGGCPRNYVRSSTDDPAAADERELCNAVRSGTVSVSTGIFVEARIGESLPGSIVRAPGGNVAISIRVQAAPWIRADHLVVVANGEEVSTTEIPRKTSVLRHEGTFHDRPARDTWYIVYARGDEAPVPMQHPTAFPLGFTNAFRVDVDGDGRFTPLREHARRAVEAAFETRSAAGILRETPSFRRQAVGALREVEAALVLQSRGVPKDLAETGVLLLAELLRDSTLPVRRGAAAALALRPERSALLALLEAGDSAQDPSERTALAFDLVQAGHLPSLLTIRDAYAASSGLELHALRRDLLELARKTRLGPWKAAGPYPSPRWEEGLACPLPCEEPAGDSPGASWRRVGTDKKAYLNFRDVMDPAVRAAACARLHLQASEPLRTFLLLESGNALVILLNQHEIFRVGPEAKGKGADGVERPPRGLILVPVAFPRGPSEILVRSAVEKGPWGFQMHAIDPRRVLEPAGL